MNIIIPMAGMGKRMRPHTLTVPKPLINVAGKTIVKRLCQEIVKVCNTQIDNIGFIVSDFGQQVENQLIEIAESLGAKGSIYYQKEPLGTAHAILCGKELLEGNVTIAFADTLFDAGFELDTSADGIIWTQRVENPSAFGVVKKSEQGIITGFVEKPVEFVSDEAIIGIYYFRDGANLHKELQFLLDNNIKSLGEYQLTDALQNMLDKGMKLTTSSVKQWLDCGNKNATVFTNQRMLELKKDSEQMISRNVENINSLIISPCFIDENVKLVNSIVGPHVSIQKDSLIEHSVVSNSIIGSATTIRNARLDSSIVGSNAKICAKELDLSVGDYNEINL
jgi:glucose-1-phosphate thymidylyltransferase